MSVAMTPAMGQATLQGRVRLPDSSAAAMAMVKVLAADSSTLLRYTRAGSLGEWSIDRVALGQYVLQVAYLGLETWTQRIEVTEAKTRFFDIVLQERPLTLHIVEISAKRIGIVERGDTLEYDLSRYLDSTEYNLKDILNRLPDISVDEEGIRYKGKRVQVALVEGRDVFGGLHKIMTEGIRAEDVKGVQIIRNYTTGAEQVAKEISDKVAVNVQLTDEARRKLKGEVGFLTDANKFVEGNLTFYRTKPKGGYSVIGRANNTGSGLVISPADVLALVDLEDLQPRRIRGSETEKEMLPSFLFPRPDAQRVFDMFTTLNGDVSLSARLNGKLNVRFIETERRMENVLFRLYIQDNALFHGARNRKNKTDMFQASLKNYYRGRRAWIKQHFLLTSTTFPESTRLKGELSGMALENRFFKRDNHLYVQVGIEGGVNIDSQRVLKGYLHYRHNGRRDHAVLQSPGQLFGTRDSLLEQRNNVRETTLLGELALRCPIGTQQLTASLGYSRTSYALEASTLIPQPKPYWDLEAHMSDAGMFGEIALKRQGNFRYSVHAKTTLLQRTFPNAPSTNYRYLLSDIEAGLYRDFSLLNHLYITAGYITSPTPFVHLWRYNRVRDENSLYAERVDSSFVQQEAFVSLEWRVTMDSESGWNISHKASIKKSDVLYQHIPMGNYLLYQSLLAPHVAQLRTRGSIYHRLSSIHTRVGTYLSHEYKSGFAALSERLLGVNNHDLRISLSSAFEGWKRLEIGADHTYVYHSQHYEGQEALIFHYNTTTVRASYRHNNWNANVSLAYHRQRISQALNPFWGLSFHLERRLSKPPILLRLTGRNVLNLQGNDLFMPEFGANYIGTSYFRTIGGQIMAGVAYVF